MGAVNELAPLVKTALVAELGGVEEPAELEPDGGWEATGVTLPGEVTELASVNTE